MLGPDSNLIHEDSPASFPSSSKRDMSQDKPAPFSWLALPRFLCPLVSGFTFVSPGFWHWGGVAAFPTQRWGGHWAPQRWAEYILFMMPLVSLLAPLSILKTKKTSWGHTWGGHLTVLPLLFVFLSFHLLHQSSVCKDSHLLELARRKKVLAIVLYLGTRKCYVTCWLFHFS
jgi:hypothetical protein